MSDLGGPDAGLSEAQLSLVRRASALEVELELAEGKLSRGEPVDLDLFGRLLGQLRRVLEAIGLERRARPAITLEQYLELTSAPANATNATPPEENQA